MQGFSAQQPEGLIRFADGYQVRTNIESVLTETDTGPETQWIYDYINVPLQDPASREFKKYVRDALMQQALVTTVAGNTFDADEKSQERMVRALNVAQLTGLLETQWVLADNSVATVSKEELAEALSLAMQLQGVMWFV